MTGVIRRLYHFILERKQHRYLARLQRHGLRLGNNLEIHTGFFFDPSHCYLISIGNNCVFAPNVRLIAHDASAKHAVGYAKIGRIDIGDNCFLGDSVIVLPGVCIGSNSIIGAGSIVTKDIPPDSVAAGSPARVLCSAADYADKMRRLSTGKKVFGREYHMDQLDDAKRAEVLAALENNVGFMV